MKQQMSSSFTTAAAAAVQTIYSHEEESKLFQRKCQQKDSWKVDILFCNLFLRPQKWFPDAQLQRVQAFVEQLRTEAYAHYDVLSLCEVFDDECYACLVKHLPSMGFVHTTQVLGASRLHLTHQLSAIFADHRLIYVNGGVVVFSKHPIIATDAVEFDIHHNELSKRDSLSCKGFIYTKIQNCFNYKSINIITSHMESARTPIGDLQRINSARSIKQFVESCSSIYKHEPLLILGDLNQHNNNKSHAWRQLLKEIDAAEFLHGIHDVTIRPQHNILVGKDGDKDVPECRLDHCVYSTRHLIPLVHASSCHAQRIIPTHAIEHRVDRKASTKLEQIHDISDHDALNLHITFPHLQTLIADTHTHTDADNKELCNLIVS